MPEPDTGLMAKLIADHVSDGIVLTDAEGKVVWSNPAFTRMSGYDLKDLFGKKPGDVLQGERTSLESKSKLAASIATKTQCQVDIVNYTKDGKDYITEINLSPIFDDNGKLTHFVAIQRVVTSERALAQESIDFKAYQQALDQQAIISVTDPRGKIVYANSKFSSISGYSNEELIGQTHSILNSGTHDRKFFQELWRTIKAGKTWHGDVCNVSKKGVRYWVDTTIVPVHGPDGEIVRYASIRYEITDRKSMEGELRHIAETDTLTGLANRARFIQNLKQNVAETRNDHDDVRMLVVMIDLDHFKEFNDSFGHHYGDLLLKEISLRLKKLVGPDCVVARIGGDEFAMLIPSDVTGDDPKGYINAIKNAASQPISFSDLVYLPSFSMGVTHYPRDSQTLEGLMINADVALYEAKHNGRDQVYFFDPTVLSKLKYRKQLKAILVDALKKDRFEIAMQPFCYVQTFEHCGFEVLVRLSHDGKPVPPDHFIPLAEELGLITAIGKVVREKAMAARRMMVDQGFNPKKIAINVAAPELCEPMFAENLQAMLQNNDMPPEELIVEITETALIGRSTDTVAKVLSKLQEIGVLIALDDFGTGFSSLSHLSQFHVDKIKIDKSFVQFMEHDESARALVDGVIMLAHRLGLRVIAEGVETAGQRELLRQFGCHFLQGYFHSKPLPPAEAVKFLKSQEEAANAVIYNND